VSRTPSAVNARRGSPPISGRPGVWRWSSQTIAGRSDRPSASVTTIVDRWVVIVSAAKASLVTDPPAHNARHASPIARQ